MFLSDLAIARPVAAVMITIALIIFGLIAYSKLGVETNPDIELPFLTVVTIYPGADPATVESEVTDPIEDAVATISGIKNLTSTSSENISFIFIEFELEVDIDVVAQDVRDKMAQIQRSLPDDADLPVVQKFDIGSMPIMSIAVGGEIEPQALASYIEDVVKPRLEAIEGVGNLDITGLRDREIRIRLDPDRMASYDISAQQVVSAIQLGHVEIPGGRIETGEREYLVITSGELESVQEFENLVVATRRGTLIRMRDVAEVVDGLEDQRSLARLNGVPSIGIGVIKKSGANVVEIADEVYEVVDDLKAQAPPGLEITVPVDNSTYIRDSLHEVQGHLIGGGLMAIIIVLLFLGNFRSTIIAAISIPTAIITTYIAVEGFGFTLNNVTMLAFTLMVGMLIDDTIVIVENIYRHVEMGKGSFQAAKDGVKEVGFAVLATTLTVLAVFIPVALMSGIIGRFMYQYGITVAVGSIASYVIAITLAPMLASRFLSSAQDNFILFRWFNNGFRRLERGYRWLIGAALRRKGLTLLIAFISMIVALGLFYMTKKEFMPPPDMSSSNISIEMPLGTSMQSLSEFTEQIEEIVIGIPEVENVYTTLGGGTYGDQNEGSIFIDLPEKTERDRTVWDIEDEIRELIRGIPGAKMVVGGQVGFGHGTDFQFELTGHDMDALQEFADQLTGEMAQMPMFRDVDTSSREGKPEVRINIDRDRAADLDINVAAIGSTLRLLVSGEEAVSSFMEGGRQYDIKVRLEESYRNRPEDLSSLIVYNRDDDAIEVSSFADIDISSGTSEIGHSNKLRSITLLANISQGNTLGEATEWTNEVIDTRLPPGITGRILGEAEIMEESFTSMATALILAIILIYVILAAQFNHFIHPLTIMISLPLSFVGAFGLLFITNMTVNIFSLIGIIMLMGIVTKNAILVVEFANQLRAKGMERDEAMLTAGPIRLRPVLMTALSTVGGMLPVALMIGGGAGVEIRAPMAVAVIGGLLASTLLTLVVVPVVYSLFDQATTWFLRVSGIGRFYEKVRLDIPSDQVDV